jgi:hypothetical protein
LLVPTEQLADAGSCALNRAYGLVEAMKNDEKEIVSRVSPNVVRHWFQQ